MKGVLAAVCIAVWSIGTASCRYGFDVASEADGGRSDRGDASVDVAISPFGGCVPGESECDWTARTTIVIEETANTEALADVPIPIVLDDGFDFSRIESDGSDLRFANAAETEQLAFEIEQFEQNRAVIWVRIPRLEVGAGATILLYSGNPNAARIDGGVVFDDDYVGVWHMGDRAGDGNADSSRYGNDATAVGPVTPAAGVVGGASEFTGTSFSDAGNDATLALTTSGTLEAWVRFETISIFAAPIAKSQFGDTPNYSYGFQRNGEVNEEMGLSLSNGATEDEATTNAGGFPTDEWIHFAARWDADSAEVLVNGVRSGARLPSPVTPQVNADHLLTIGCGYSPDCSSDAGIDGFIDEARVSRIARSNEWLSTQVRAMNGALVQIGNTDLR